GRIIPRSTHTRLHLGIQSANLIHDGRHAALRPGKKRQTTKVKLVSKFARSYCRALRKRDAIRVLAEHYSLRSEKFAHRRKSIDENVFLRLDVPEQLQQDFKIDATKLARVIDAQAVYVRRMVRHELERDEILLIPIPVDGFGIKSQELF